MLPSGMKHSVERDAELEREAISRAYATPEELQAQAVKKSTLQSLVPEDIQEYKWMLEPTYVALAIKYVVIAALIAAVLVLIGGVGQALLSQERSIKKTFSCDNPFLARLCAPKASKAE
jgi:hypothetical protein